MEEIKKTILFRTYMIYFIFAMIGMAIVGKAAHIQLVEGHVWREKSQRLTLRYENIEPVRGNIYSSDGKLLAVSVPIYEIRMDVASPHITDEFFRSKVDSLALCLANLFRDRSAADYKRLLVQARRAKNRYLLIKRNVSYTELKELRTFPIFNLGRFRGGLIANQQSRREYPFRDLAYRTIGWDREGTENDVGLEGAYSQILSGTSGQKLMQRIGSGAWRPVSDSYEINPHNGQDIVTSIDATIQDVAHNALLRQMQANRAEHGCVVLMEVETGFVRAIVNLMRTEHGTYEERYNYAIAHSSEPGSTFKLASMLAALEDKAFDLNDSIDTGKGITFYSNRRMQDSEKDGYGTITAQHAFEVSSNVGVSRIIYEYYNDKPHQFIKRLHSMGLSEPLGIELAGEGMPYIKTPDHSDWSGISLPWMSIGYEIRITPLQILAFYNAIANNGRMMKPLFVQEIREAGRTVKRFNPEVINSSVASRRSVAKAHEMLVGVVENGTARHLKNSAYSIAGKTGTAQIAAGSAGYNKSDYKASFAGYFPADDPKYSMIVVISNPRQGLYYGAHTSAPVFREIADKVYATNLEIQQQIYHASATPQNTRLVAGKKDDFVNVFGNLNYPVIDESSSEWTVVRIENDTVRIQNRSIQSDRIPNVIGMSARDATYIIERMGLRVMLNGIGTVRRQTPGPGANFNKSTEVTLHLST